MKPFDLERALAGDPVVTREGESVTQLHLFDIDYPKNYGSLAGVINGEVYLWFKSGSYMGKEECYRDLFMASTKHEGWVLRHKSNNQNITSYIYSSPEDALGGLMEPENYDTHRIEWEE